MKILITGSTSTVTKALKPALSELGEVLTAGRKEANIYFDLNDTTEETVLPNGIDVLIHTASKFGGQTNQDLIETESANVIGTLKLLSAAKEAGVGHFILISSIFSQLEPRSPHYNIYALSKKHTEEVCSLFCLKNSLPLTIVRPSQLYGKEEYFSKHQPFFYSIINKAQNNQDIILQGNPGPKRNYLFITDLTNIIFKITKNKITGTYSCAFPQDISYLEIATAAVEAFNSKSEIICETDKPILPDNIFSSDDTIYKKIGFYPEVSIKSGMKRIAEYRNSGK